MPNRYIGDNIKILYDILYYTESQNIPGVLLRLNFKKKSKFWGVWCTLNIGFNFLLKILNKLFLLMVIYLRLLTYTGDVVKETHCRPIYSYFV